MRWNPSGRSHYTQFSTLSDIKIITREIYDSSSRTWTHRAGSFIEQSRAFIDTYLGRWDRGNENGDEEEDTLQGEECTSGATSGEEVWGTPTSGENDEMQMFNSDQTHSVKRKPLCDSFPAFQCLPFPVPVLVSLAG